MDIGFIDHLRIVTASNYYSLTELHTPNITVTTAHIKSSLRSLTFNWALLQLTRLSESEFLYDWRFTANQFVLVPSPLRLTTSDFNIAPDESMDLSFTVAAGPLMNMLGQLVTAAPNRPCYNISARTAQKTPFLRFCTIVAFMSLGIPTWSLLSQSIGALVAA
jgi:hypothetical protein